ncbi:hypothetical protein [Aureimonas psammosilenae]|uniref:hypothetical protein n=1 Tax=Aureimonas psammosilenae TaxID=2495496 RepID=UPI001260D500|nr:hypothetical protein [Aureimonas psammosilenae]
MKRIVATFAAGLFVTSALCGPGHAQTAQDTGAQQPVVVPAAVQALPAPVPAVSNETTGSLPEEPAASGAEGAEHPAEPAPAHAETPAEPSEGSDAAHGEEEHAAAAAAPTRTPMPFDIIRTVQFLQDQVARGNGRAIRVQAMLLRRFSPNLLSADQDVWKDPRNKRAAILFALSGGPPEVLRRLIAAEIFDPDTKPIAEGALAYVQNDLKQAASLLAKIDLTDAEPGLAAHLHLVTGQLLQQDLPTVAVAHLDRARLLAPGGLIEEAALRLEVVLVDKLGDHDRADSLARQYFDRFPKSSYAENFLARFAMVYDDRGSTEPQAALDKIFDIGSRLDDGDRRALLLALSRRALIAGHLEFAQLTGSEALKINGIQDEDRQRGSLYTAAASLATMDPLKAATELQSVDRGLLHPADTGLLDAANSVLAHMEGPLSDDSTSLEAQAASSPTLDRARKLLDAVAGDLGDKSK